ncbi:MIP/aquaporin family protein [Microbacterium sp. MPKO10]|uniref:MIP/aquaporin family protein n=1 Tax=Microbacterium sp. MPKO10 TaxID=2989818 RepID=UPI00223582DA|nr:aquaporin [Microbacterium sp. MPKO10]MCW4457422.1 aquaporin [Microbacterium sp. MPKO10]
MTGTIRKATAEALATFLFVFAIIAAVNNAGDFAPLAIGFALMVLVYATGHISGGHINPAVSLGALLRGAMSVGDFFAYIVAQFIGGALGALLSMAILPRPEAALEIEVVPSFIVEAVFSFILVYVVLNTATSKDHDGNSFYGLAIGTTVFVGAATVGSISGGGFNPAVGLGLAVSGQFSWSALWLYVVAPLVGGALAAGAFRLLNVHDLAKKADAER